MGFDGRAPLIAGALAAWPAAGGWEITRRPDGFVDQQVRERMLRRIAFFERRDGDWKWMLPYHNLTLFREITQKGRFVDARLRRQLVEGISRSQGAREPEIARTYICLRAGQAVRGRIKSFRLFPSADFTVELPKPRVERYLEYTADQFFFVHRPRDVRDRVEAARSAELVVSLDLLELLLQIAEGYAPSPDDISGFFINLVIFTNALAHLPYRRVVLTRDDSHFYEVAVDDQTNVTLRPWESERNLAGEAQS
jgi:hypothetical protein